MQQESLLQNSRWQVLKAITQSHTSASEIAKVINTSIPNVTQQLKLLEAYGIVAFDKEKKEGLGKPRQLYKLTKPVASIALARDGMAKQKFFQPCWEQALILSSTFIKSPQEQFCLLKFLFNNEEILQKCGVAYVKSSSEEIEIFLLTELLDEIRKKYSSGNVECGGKKFKVVAWTHSFEEVKDGLARDDKHFIHLLKDSLILHDPENKIAEALR